ncbi:MAG TPA: PadR family transcriptional regulator [Gemmatimonadaceae bacterium]|nr:PadR family transcriptional regulator [Gemmatimonadaceae bacterium]
MPHPPLDLLHGTVDLLVLRTLAWERMHGYGIGQFVKARTDGAIAIDSAALYQALHRLEKRKLVRASWGVSETNRRARFYELTAAGRTALKAQSSDLRAYVAALYRVLDAR